MQADEARQSRAQHDVLAGSGPLPRCNRRSPRTRVIGDGHALHLGAFAITDILVAFALGLFPTQRIEMNLRAKRLLETARVR